MEKINWNKKRDELADSMNPCPIWNEGTEAQQELADNLVEGFCKRFAKYLCWGIKDNIIQLQDAEDITNTIYMSIQEIDNAKWWCSKKSSNDFSIAYKLISDNESQLDNIKKLKKEYN